VVDLWVGHTCVLQLPSGAFGITQCNATQRDAAAGVPETDSANMVNGDEFLQRGSFWRKN